MELVIITYVLVIGNQNTESESIALFQITPFFILFPSLHDILLASKICALLLKVYKGTATLGIIKSIPCVPCSHVGIIGKCIRKGCVVQAPYK